MAEKKKPAGQSSLDAPIVLKPKKKSKPKK